jgi:hypothetical protein
VRYKKKAFVFAGFAACLAFAALAEEHRQLGAHMHGHGRLNIAIEDKTMSVELEVPAADIVGFEHEPETQEEKAVLEAAKAKLAAGLSLFTPASAAGCAQTSAKVMTEADHDEEHEARDSHHAQGSDHEHSEFHADYALECASPSQITSMSFDYFRAFPNAEALTVSLISAQGQASFEVTRGKPSVDLRGKI